MHQASLRWGFLFFIKSEYLWQKLATMKKDEFNRYLSINGITPVLLIIVIIAAIMFVVHGFVETNIPFWIGIVLISSFILLWSTALIAFKQKSK